jgi:hypothetical protein
MPSVNIAAFGTEIVLVTGVAVVNIAAFGTDIFPVTSVPMVNIAPHV